MVGKLNWSWVITFTIVVLIGLAFLSPDLVLAADKKGGSFGIDDSVAKDTVSSVKSYWDVISAIAIYGGIIVAVIMIPINKLWMGVAALVAFFGAFGEQIVKFIVRKAGGGASKHLDRTSFIPSHEQMVDTMNSIYVAVHQPDTVVAAIHNVLTLNC